MICIQHVNKGFRNLQAEVSQAIAMVSYYASSSEPAQVRGKTVYIQYSNRHEIVHNKSPGDVPGNVLLVTIEGVEAGDVSIETLHLVSNVLKCTFDSSLVRGVGQLTSYQLLIYGYAL